MATDDFTDSPVTFDLDGATGTGIQIVHVAESARSQLRLEAADIGGRSPLVGFQDVPEAGIDISKAHPGSIPQFITGKSTLLSNLFRDEVGLRTARLAAERITAKQSELRSVRGIDTVHLAVGLASWRMGGVEYCAPVLLRPLAIRRHHSDFELKLQGTFTVNPELVRLGAEHFGMQLDATALASLAYADGIFQPQPVIDRLRAETHTFDTYAVHPRLVVSTFADVGSALARDLVAADHPILNAMAGHISDRESVTAIQPEVEVISPDLRAPESDNNLLDADAEQEAVLARIAAGQSLVAATLPGTGGTQTVINALGSFVRAGKRVLVVSPRRATLDGIRYRLAGVGLDGMAVSPQSLRRDLIRSIARNEKVQEPAVAEIDEALVRLRGVLCDYRNALVEPHHSLGVSVLNATRELVRLASLPSPPSTQVRLSHETLAKLVRKRGRVSRTLVQAAELGEFRLGPQDSPWYGVNFTDSADALAAHALAESLHRTTVPELLERGFALVAQTHMRPFSSIDELGSYLSLLSGIRDSLDRFTVTVFERPLGEVIAAHAPRRDDPEMTGAQRRRLRKLANEYVRPGVHVSDMYEALLRVQRQRADWRRYIETDVAPEVPLGLAELQSAWEGVQGQLDQLDKALGRTGVLTNLPIDQLLRALAALAAPSELFDKLAERAEVRGKLFEWGLEELVADLANRHVDAEHVVNELTYAWWRSFLEHALQDDRALLGANTGVVDRLERDFRFVDESHASASGALLAGTLASKWRVALIDEPAEAANLRQLLVREDATPAQVHTAAPTLVNTLAPVWLASPYQVPSIPESVWFDAVLLVDAGAINLVEAAPAMRRARQVVAFGDPMIQAPSPFTVASVPDESWQPETDFDDVSVFERLGDLLPVATLTYSYRAGGEDLAELVNDAFYGGEIRSLPWAGSYLGRESLTVDYVEGGVGKADPETSSVESPDAEVARVVSLVVEHAVHRPTESLMVVTANQRHADRLRQAVTVAFAGRADVAEFVERETAEPFVVANLEESAAESRDRVIFSLGFGLTKHGRLLSNFGELSTPDGERLLTVAMTRARRSMVLVSSITPSAATTERLTHGAASLMALLESIQPKAATPQPEEHADALTRELARRLRVLGVQVDINYRGLLPLVAKHDGKAIVIEIVPEASGVSLRESLRLRPMVLRRLGWHYVRVHAFDLYADPASVANRVAEVLGIDIETPRAVTSSIAVTPSTIEPRDKQ